MLRLTLRDFKRAGVDRDEATRARIAELADRETVVGQEFSKNIREDVRTIQVTTDAARRACPTTTSPATRRRRRPARHHHRLPRHLSVPDVLRPTPPHAATAHIAFLNRGWPANDALLRELLDLRAEHAGTARLRGLGRATTPRSR